MINLGELRLDESKEKEMFYVAIDYRRDIYVSNRLDDVSNAEEKRKTGKIEVYYDGLYFGTVEEMYNNVSNKIIDYLIEKEFIKEEGETIAGDIIYKWNK